MTHNLQVGDIRINRETGFQEMWNGQFWERIDDGFVNAPSKKNKTTGIKQPMEDDIPVIPPTIGDERGDDIFLLPKKPTVAFVTGMIPTVLVLLIGLILTFIKPTGDIWSFTWLIIPTFVLAIIVFTLLWWVARKSGSLRYFTRALIATVLIILILFVLSFILIGPYLGFFGCLFLLPSAIVAYSFIRAYREV